MISNKIVIGQIDTGIHPDLPYLSDYTIHLTTLDKNGNLCSTTKAHKGDFHGSHVASIICGSFYNDNLPSVNEIHGISIPRLGKTILCLLRALDIILTSNIRVLCLPIGINLPTPIFRSFIKALKAKGMLVVAPSGNKGKGTVLTPGSYPEVLTVGALTQEGNVASYSGRSLGEMETGRKPDIFVRGEFPDPTDPGSGKTIYGTSMSCAFIAGKAARIWNMFPEATLKEVMTKLEIDSTVQPIIPRFLRERYIDARLKTALNQIGPDEKAEGIIISGKVNKTNIEIFSINKLLAEVEEMAGCSPIEVNYFKIDNVVYLQATSSFFKTLLQHRGLYCAQAVDVSMFDM